MCLSLCGIFVPTYASATQRGSQFVASSGNDSEVMPMNTQKLTPIDGDVLTDLTYEVTPTKGSNLKVIIQATDNCLIQVYKGTGPIESFFPIKQVKYTKGSGTVTFDLVNNCYGGVYQVNFNSVTGVRIFGYLIQTDVT